MMFYFRLNQAQNGLTACFNKVQLAFLKVLHKHIFLFLEELIFQLLFLFSYYDDE